MAYIVSIASSALRALSRLPKDAARRIRELIDSLTASPRPHGAKPLQGVTGVWRARVGDYRVVYRIDDRAVTVLVVRIGHRRDVYRGL
ncbi:MAG: type II toxin-antitoxin system RelE/ParE family toxin [Deltaproteobacteria bacterium]|nr:type II toxin-antitoxin system RelE/ParE family toxin [Deltaproteobacteria bacterium]